MLLTEANKSALIEGEALEPCPENGPVPFLQTVWPRLVDYQKKLRAFARVSVWSLVTAVLDTTRQQLPDRPFESPCDDYAGASEIAAADNPHHNAGTLAASRARGQRPYL